MRYFILATVALMFASVPAQAQENPLEQFFNSLLGGNSRTAVIEQTSPAYPRSRSGRRMRYEAIETPNAIARYSGRTALATWYGYEMLGKGRSGRTANGERFIPGGMTVAHKTLPFGTRIQFTNPKTGRTAIGRVNDRGPFRRGYTYDLAQGLARSIGHTGSGAVIATILN